MRAWDWLRSVRTGVLKSRRSRRAGGRVEVLEQRCVLAEDFGDAPDLGAGIGPGSYATLLAQDGPRHTVVAGLFLGARVDGEANAVANDRANGDDSTPNTGPDDEDGVVNPQADLLLTTGAQPTITLRATNTTGTAATLSGWIDTNNNGVFDTASERAQVAVPAGTNNGLFTLTFPAVPSGFTGETYARFRLGTDAAAQSPTGASSAGEVEDYLATVTRLGAGEVKSGGVTKLASGGVNMPMLADDDSFGTSTTSIGDLDGDGVTDLAVGVKTYDFVGNNPGAFHVLFMNANGTVKSSRTIASGTNGGPMLGADDGFGSSIANMGDLDGDGVADLAVGASRDSTGGQFRGAVHLLFMKSDGTVKSSMKIASGIGGGPTLVNFDSFGTSVTSIGDLDGDGVTDLAVGAIGPTSAGQTGGELHILFLNPNGTAKSSTKISRGTGGGPSVDDEDAFGGSVANIGDLDGDGVTDLAVGATGDDTGGFFRGAVYVLFLNANGTVKMSTKIASGTGGGPTLPAQSTFGASIANVGDLDGDGNADLAVGADGEAISRGAVHILLLNSNGTVKSSTKINSTLGGGPTLMGFDRFGISLSNLGDFDGDGLTDLAVGASSDDTEGTDRGAVYILRLSEQPVPANRAPVLDASGNPFTILGVGSRQSTDMRQGVTVASILARGAGGNPITDADSGALRGIAITATDTQFGTFQYSLTATNPAEESWFSVGTVSNTSALLLPDTARVRFVTGLIPHHAAGAPFLPLESKLDTGLTFRAWDQTTGAAGNKVNTSANGATSAFSTATETAKVYFEARLFRSFNSNAQLNVYTLEAEFNALTANPSFADRSTAAFTGFTVLMSDVPELGTAPLFRMYFGVQFNDDGTETDMGYRYLTANAGEAAILEGLGRADKRATREGAYFRELGVNNGTAALGYIFTAQQPGTSKMTQIYRTDSFAKPTRPPGTVEGGTPTSTRNQEQGDHVYTTNTTFETGKPGTWRIEADRGFVRELTPVPTPVPPAASATSASRDASGAFAPPVAASTDGEPAMAPVDLARLIAIPEAAPVVTGTANLTSPSSDDPQVSDDPVSSIVGLTSVDLLFSDLDLVADFGLAG